MKAWEEFIEAVGKAQYQKSVEIGYSPRKHKSY